MYGSKTIVESEKQLNCYREVMVSIRNYEEIQTQTIAESFCKSDILA